LRHWLLLTRPALIAGLLPWRRSLPAGRVSRPAPRKRAKVRAPAPSPGAINRGGSVGSARGRRGAGRPRSPAAPPGALQATRALMVVAAVLGVLGIAVSTMGMKCTRCGGDDKVQKARIAVAGGVIFIVAGLAALVTCSWYGHQIVSDFYNPTVPVNLKYEFGSAIFVGWAGSALALLGGSLLACSCPAGARGGAPYPRGKAARPPSSREYV
ncbi:claudin-7-like, partial [Apteryx rowi]|uniref:claudin-7-like n=1 Tax=Apteryx rowi TaxID=308060 RepID=UPI000E1DFD42